MKLERNRAERRSKRGVPVMYKGIPYLIFAALAAGFLLGAPQLTATSAIAQADKNTVSVLESKQLPFVFAGYLGKTNSVISRGFQDGDFTYTGSYTWVDDLTWRARRACSAAQAAAMPGAGARVRRRRRPVAAAAGARRS